MDEKYEYVTILFEKMQGDIKQVLEGHQVLHNEITRTREELREEIQLNTIRIDAFNESLSNRIDAFNESLSNRIDSVEENLGSHIDAVAVDLKAHRADTEAHHGIYRVKENGLCFSFSPFFSLTNV